MNIIQTVKRNEEKTQQELKNFFLYSTGKTISIFGTAIYQFALGLYVLKLTGSALSFAFTLILGVIPMIIHNPVAGVIADKWDKKTLVVSMDLINGFLLLMIYSLSGLTGLTLVLIYVTTFLTTVCTTFFGVALESAKPNMVSGKKLMEINSVSRIIDSISSILGPMLGGVVFVLFDIRTFILVNGLTFILSGLTMLFIEFKLFKHPSHEKKKNEKTHFIQDLKDGFHYILVRKTIVHLVMVLISLNFFLGFAVTIPMPYIINTVLELGSKSFGIIQAFFPVGMILGAMLVKKITAKISYSALLRWISISLSNLMTLSGIPIIIEGFSLSNIFYVGFYSMIMLFFGLSVALIDIPLAYYIQKEIPDEYRGRVLSTAISSGKIMLPLAMLLSGVLLNHLPAYVIPIVGGVLFFGLNKRSANKLKINITS